MSWLDKLGKKKESEKKPIGARAVIPVCTKCDKVIKSMDVSIGDVLEKQGACLYSGSEGHLYEPLYEGSICLSCRMMLCDDCLSEIVDTTRCPKCGGTLRTITERRLPKVE